jgi:hypothetical protein
MTLKIDAMVAEVPQTFEYGNLFAREDVGGHARLRVGLNEAQDACVLTLECVPLRLDLAGRILSGHSLTQRTETAICFWPWG